jgi:hypothetical protein
MDCKIVNCKCGEKIGVITEDGFMIGNQIFESFHCWCPNCDLYLDYEDFELVFYNSDTEEKEFIEFTF